MDKNLKKKMENYFSDHNLVKYKKGEVILRPGEKPGYVGYIKSGYVRVYTLSENGQEITMQFFKPILYFTSIYALTGIENRFYFEAITPVEMYTASVNEVEELFVKNPELKDQVVNNILLSFVDLVEQMGVLLSGSAYNKVATMVSSLANRTVETIGHYEHIDFGITHKLIASLTGLTRETVTLQMLKLEKEGLIINKNKKVIVVDQEKLANATKK